MPIEHTAGTMPTAGHRHPLTDTCPHHVCTAGRRRPWKSFSARPARLPADPQALQKLLMPTPFRWNIAGLRLDKVHLYHHHVFRSRTQDFQAVCIIIGRKADVRATTHGLPDFSFIPPERVRRSATVQDRRVRQSAIAGHHGRGHLCERPDAWQPSQGYGKGLCSDWVIPSSTDGPRYLGQYQVWYNAGQCPRAQPLEDLPTRRVAGFSLVKPVDPHTGIHRVRGVTGASPTPPRIIVPGALGATLDGSL